ncbi:Uncharacterised protein [Mycobacteroides abscessus subsp. bolletii]|nr:Uncharacterised protein [Mycobacteroides abscessus subsp. bolletii]
MSATVVSVETGYVEVAVYAGEAAPVHLGS